MTRIWRTTSLIVVLFVTTSLILAGSTPASAQTTQAGQQLNIVVQSVSHLSGCVQMSVAARGDSIPFLINVTYASTGKAMSNGTVEVHMSNGQLLKAAFSATHNLWAVVYPIPWAHPTGPLGYYVTAQSADGAVGSWEPITPYGALTIVPASLHVDASAIDEKTNQPIQTASEGSSIKIVATVALPLPGQGYPTQTSDSAPQVDGAGMLLNSTMASKVQAVIGQGTFNSTTASFSNYTASTITLSYDAASSKWTGSYSFKQNDPSGLYEIAVIGADKASPPNTGFAFTNTFTLGSQSTGGINTGTVYIASFGMIIIGFVAGLAVISKFALPKRKGDQTQ
jgi:hypothetical protein